MKAKKIVEKTNKKNPGRNLEKKIELLSNKGRPGTAKGTMEKNNLNLSEPRKLDEAKNILAAEN
jgi:hypothetical protein